jgi:integrase
MHGRCVLTEEGEKAFFAAVASPKYEAMLRLAYFTGLPRTRLVRLCWGEVNLDTKQIVSLTPWAQAFSLPPDAAELLRRLRPARMRRTAPVFPSRSGGHLSPRTVGARFAEIRRRIGLDYSFGYRGIHDTWRARQALARGRTLHVKAQDRFLQWIDEPNHGDARVGRKG